MNLTPISKRTIEITITAIGRDGDPIEVSTVYVARLETRAKPDEGTVWVSASVTNNMTLVTLAGPDADPDGAVVFPSGGSELWLKIVDGIEVEAFKVGRVQVT